MPLAAVDHAAGFVADDRLIAAFSLAARGRAGGQLDEAPQLLEYGLDLFVGDRRRVERWRRQRARRGNPLVRCAGRGVDAEADELRAIAEDIDPVA